MRFYLGIIFFWLASFGQVWRTLATEIGSTTSESGKSVLYFQLMSFGAVVVFVVVDVDVDVDVDVEKQREILTKIRLIRAL